VALEVAAVALEVAAAQELLDHGRLFRDLRKEEQLQAVLAWDMILKELCKVILAHLLQHITLAVEQVVAHRALVQEHHLKAQEE
jgi:hypothetical protein